MRISHPLLVASLALALPVSIPAAWADTTSTASQLDTMTITEDAQPAAPDEHALRAAALADKRARTTDTARLLEDIPGLILQAGGGL